MKTVYLFTSLALFTCSNLIAQIPFAELDNNNIRARVNGNSDLFWDPASQTGKFEAPKDSLTTAIFTGNIWMGGLAPDNQLHLAAETYASSSNHDFDAGPIANVYNSIYDTLYNRVWKISKQEIDNHKLNYNQGSYVMPEVIFNWPAHGNINNGEAANLAPYEDFNNNDVYDPENGDYPLIRGDVAIFSMFNDKRNSNGFSGGNQLEVEVHSMVYAYSQNGHIGNSIFVNYTIFNRSSRNYHDFYLGNWFDFDLGNFSDDYVGSNPEKNLFYCYNADNTDEDFNSLKGYGENPPSVGCVFLSTDLNAFAYYSQSIDPSTGEPTNSTHFYNYLRGNWKDGSTFREGGNGHTNGGGGATPTKFMFNGDPVTNSGWSEISENTVKGDRRGLGSAGPFTLDENTSLCIDFALVFAASGISNLASVSELVEASDSIKQFYDEQSFDCNAIEIDPFTFIVSNTTPCIDELVTVVNTSVGDALGYKWFFEGASPNVYVGENPPKITYDIEDDFDVTMRVYLSNGDSIDITKPNLISVQRTKYFRVNDVIINYVDSCPGGLITVSAASNFLLPSASTKNWYKISASGDTTLQISTISRSVNLYGFYSADKLLLVATNPPTGCYESDLVTFTKDIEHPVYFPEMSININSDHIICNTPFSGVTYTWIHNISPDTSEVISNNTNTLYPSEDGYYSLHVDLNDIPYCHQQKDTFYFDFNMSIFNNYISEYIKIYPNPANEMLTIVNANISAFNTKIEILDLTGKVVLNKNTSSQQTQFDVSSLASGIYFIQLISGNERHTEKLIIE
jgi:hypothetical protein